MPIVSQLRLLLGRPVGSYQRMNLSHALEAAIRSTTAPRATLLAGFGHTNEAIGVGPDGDQHVDSHSSKVAAQAASDTSGRFRKSTQAHIGADRDDRYSPKRSCALPQTDGSLRGNASVRLADDLRMPLGRKRAPSWLSRSPRWRRALPLPVVGQSIWIAVCSRRVRRRSSRSWSPVRLARLGPRDVTEPTGA
jgi:hypothetical protein